MRSDWEKRLEQEQAQFILGWDWERVVETWTHVLESFNTPIQPLFHKVPIFDPSTPNGKNIAGTTEKCFFEYWKPEEFEKNHLSVQNWYLLYPGTYGPLNYHQLASRGEYDTLELLYKNRNDVDGIAATMIAASLFERMDSSRLSYPRDYWPNINLLRPLKSWARNFLKSKDHTYFWNTACTHVLPRDHEWNHGIYESDNKIQSMHGIIEFLATEHAKTLNSFKFVEIFFSDKVASNIVPLISEKTKETSVLQLKELARRKEARAKERKDLAVWNAKSDEERKKIHVETEKKRKKEQTLQEEKRKKEDAERALIKRKELQDRQVRISNDSPNSDDWDHLTKNQLERLVWLKPTLELSKQLGISDVGIAKKCKRLGIKKPPRGYWAKVEAGKIGPPKGRPSKK